MLAARAAAAATGSAAALPLAPMTAAVLHAVLPPRSDVLSAGRASKAAEDPLAHVVAHAQRKGFVFPSAALYPSSAIGYDYGPLGAQLKHNVLARWWRDFVTRRRDVVPLDTCALAPAAVWRGSGHLQHFSDPLTECAACKRRYRADHLVTPPAGGEGDPAALLAALRAEGVACPGCGAVGEEGLGLPRPFNMLFKTAVGAVEGAGAEAYLRPETAQGVYAQWRNVHTVTRGRLPLGVAAVGRSYRNEVSTGNFIFRTREFEQAEVQHFCAPADAPALHAAAVEAAWEWLLGLGLAPHRLRKRRHEGGELAHYAVATVDIEYKYPFGWGELWGVSHRGDYDLARHAEATGADLRVALPGGKALPHVVEPALGVNRLLLALLCDGLAPDAPPAPAGLRRAALEEADGTPRPLLRLAPAIAPVTLAVLPLVKKHGLAERAEALADALTERAGVAVEVDAGGSIGRRYRRADEAGTPLCVTLDHDTLQDDSVTVRWRDSMQQVRLPAAQLLDTNFAADDFVQALFAPVR